ncbi:MAG: LCP family protein [Clostridia bacterium]|nr:LCP family protein [Clostridia bacterium]
MSDKKAPLSKKKKIVLIVLLSVAGALTVAGVVFGVYAYRILNDPGSFFDPSGTDVETDGESLPIQPAFTIDTEAEPDTDTEPEETTEPETDVPGVKPTEEKPYEMFNVMLMGIDANENGITSSGSMAHTDVSIVLAISFENNTMDMISLQRDTFTTVPGYRGYYKFNCAFNVGGGMDNKNSGFELVCRTAEQWLGGISIPYYYAVDFKAVVDIVDAMGGIDYDVDQPFSSHDGQTYYGYGRQHLDGNGVLGYLRVRQAADGLDKSRNTRQRKMLIAIFNKLKNEKKISMIPALLSAAGNHVYTNTNAAQTAALVNFASNLESENIRSRAVTGTIKMRYDWAWAFVDQPERVQLIKEVYNINVKPVGTCTVQFEQWLHETGLDALKHVRQAEKVLGYVQDIKNGGYVFTDEQVKQYGDCYKAYEKLYKLYSEATVKLGEVYTGQAEYEGGAETLEANFKARIEAAEKDVKEYTETLKNSVGYKGKLTYTVDKDSWYEDTDINEIYVDFR